VVYKVNPEIDTHRYHAYVKRHDDDDAVYVYQEENEGHESVSFIVSDRAELAKLAARNVELMEEEQCPSKNHLRKSK
jgi:hypothetical protein